MRLEPALPSEELAHTLALPSVPPQSVEETLLIEPEERKPGPAGRGLQASRALKRFMDVATVVVVLLLTLPVLLVLAVAIMIDSPGPPLFVHRRLGRNGRKFSLLKFRTMFAGSQALLIEGLKAEPGLMEEWTEFHKLRDDPRVTAIGRFMRRYSLDELPQLLNVLWGTMSLVGPRPITEEEIKLFGPYGDEVLSVRPGLTGLWAVSGRNDTTYDERVVLEHRYVKEWSLGLDMTILARTIPVALLGRGAY